MDLLELVGEEVMSCVRRQEEIGEEARTVFPGEIYRHEALCLMINKIVNKCGSMWSNCYSPSEVVEIQRLELSELKDQYRHKMDYTRCVASLEIAGEASQASQTNQAEILINEKADTTNRTNGMIDDYKEEDYEYNIVIDTLDMTAREDKSGGSHCDQQSCKVELVDNTENPGFFGAINKLLQPLFSLEL